MAEGHRSIAFSAKDDYPIRLPRIEPGQSRLYRLSAASITKSPKPTHPAEPVRFWFRTRCISAASAIIEFDYPHVLLLTLPPAGVPWLLRFCFERLPVPAQSWLRAAFPEWFLPDRLILKIEKRDETGPQAERFDTELEAYHRLRPLQGVLVPRLYGQVTHKGRRALLLEELGGASLGSPEGATLPLEELAELLLACFRAVGSFGILLEDMNPRNYRLVEGSRIQTLDLEDVDLNVAAKDIPFFTSTHVTKLLSNCHSLRRHYARHGLLEPLPS